MEGRRGVETPRSEMVVKGVRASLVSGMEGREGRIEWRGVKHSEVSRVVGELSIV